MGIVVQDREASAKRFLQEFGLTFPVGLDHDLKIAKAFRLVGMPLTVLVTREGKIAERIMGPIDEEQFVRKIQRLL